jgi:hypothetical protein
MTWKSMSKHDVTSNTSHVLPCTVPALKRGLEALQPCSTQRPHLTMSELVAFVGAPRNSVVRLARSLVASGFLANDAHGRLTPGPAAAALGRTYLRSLDIVEQARPALAGLADACATSAQLLEHDGQTAVVIAQALPSAAAVAYQTTRIGARFGPAQTCSTTASGTLRLLTDDVASLPDRDRLDARHANIVARALEPWRATTQRFSIGVAGPLDANTCGALDEAVRRISDLTR